MLSLQFLIAVDNMLRNTKPTAYTNVVLCLQTLL